MVIPSSFQTDLDQVQKQMAKEIMLKTIKLEDLIELPMNELDRQMCPAIFLAVNSLSGQSGVSVISLASTFQYIFLANRIHRLVTDDEDLPEHIRQYPVLVGDFMFGQSFLKMCQDDLFYLTRHFVKVIETMNEGILLRWRLKNKPISLKDYRTILGKERGALTALAARLGAHISGVPEPYIKKYEDLGFCLGMAWAAWEEPSCASLAQEYLAKVKTVMAELKEFHFQIKPLQELYEFFYEQISPNAKLAYIK